jgi:acyl-CoA reductase-like NAD-dependent aldehyde dehydrogenase
MAVWKLAPALAAGNCVVLKPAESTPVSIMVLMELIGDLLPAGVINIVNGSEQSWEEHWLLILKSLKQHLQDLQQQGV